MSLDLCTKEEKQAINDAIKEVRFSSPYGPEVKRWLKQGIGLHHAGLLPKYRILCEKLAQKGLLKVICGTDTLGVGVNVPIRTVLFTQLCKYSGDKTAILTARDFHQIAGRAGRKGFDDIGYVVAQAPEHVIENLKLEAKTKQTGKKFQKKKPPEHGYVPFDESTYKRLIAASPEPLTSSFQVSHGMLLNILSRPTDGCTAMRNLLKDCHESIASKKKLQHRAFQLFKSLVKKNIIEFVTPIAPGYSKLRVNMDLQDDFSMNQPLSLYLVDTLPKLDRESPEYALDVITLCETIVENPDAILRIQQNKARNARLDELKAQGMEFNQRMEEIEKVEYPKPLRDFIYDTFNAFAEEHPWVDVNIEPKSIVREMFENFSTFSGYVKQYGLQRMEAILLRHINGVYKVLTQTVPDGYKNEELLDMQDYLGDMIRRTDSSLLEEWEKMAHPEDYRKRMEAAGATELETSGPTRWPPTSPTTRSILLSWCASASSSLCPLCRSRPMAMCSTCSPMTSPKARCSWTAKVNPGPKTALWRSWPPIPQNTTSSVSMSKAARCTIRLSPTKVISCTCSRCCKTKKTLTTGASISM